MMTCAKEHEDVRVNIGVTGTGQKPCYRIFHRAKDTGADTIYGSYWDNHELLDEEFAVNTNWSSASMTAQEVDAFLKQKLNWNKP